MEDHGARVGAVINWRESPKRAPCYLTAAHCGHMGRSPHGGSPRSPPSPVRKDPKFNFAFETQGVLHPENSLNQMAPTKLCGSPVVPMGGRSAAPARWVPGSPDPPETQVPASCFTQPWLAGHRGQSQTQITEGLGTFCLGVRKKWRTSQRRREGHSDNCPRKETVHPG